MAQAADELKFEVDAPTSFCYSASFLEQAMRTSLQKVGKATGVVIPKWLLKRIGLDSGNKIEMTLHGNSIVLAAVGRHPREGWAEASKALAQSGEGSVWDNPEKD